jgi:ubiquinone/menaquinone biosynthesis C-methylase UbiE
MSAIERDFDRLAQFDEEGWTSNNHYHNLLLQYVPPRCEHALEIGCGTGAFARRLAARAQQVTAIDLSSEMIRVARERSCDFPNIQFAVADLLACEFTQPQFDCIATIATLHHLPTHTALAKLKHALRPGGMLLAVDLYEPERNLLSAKGLSDAFLNLVAMGTSCTLRLMHNGRLRPPPEVRAAWQAHGQHDSYLTMDEVHRTFSSTFPGVVIRKHLLWRYSAVWRKT